MHFRFVCPSNCPQICAACRIRIYSQDQHVGIQIQGSLAIVVVRAHRAIAFGVAQGSIAHSIQGSWAIGHSLQGSSGLSFQGGSNGLVRERQKCADEHAAADPEEALEKGDAGGDQL